MDYPKIDQKTVEARNSQALVIASIVQERQRQDSIFGQQDHTPFKWLSILSEEFGEVAKAINEWHWSKESPQAIIDELIQVAAVAVAAIESFSRNGFIEQEY